MGHAGNTVNRPDILNHASGGAAASVPMPVRNEDLMAQILIFKFPPGTDNGFRRNFPVIRGASSRNRHAGGRDIHKISQHFGTVYPAPPEQVVGNRVILVPADFGGHKGIQAA